MWGELLFFVSFVLDENNSPRLCSERMVVLYKMVFIFESVRMRWTSNTVTYVLLDGNSNPNVNERRSLWMVEFSLCLTLNFDAAVQWKWLRFQLVFHKFQTMAFPNVSNIPQRVVDPFFRMKHENSLFICTNVTLLWTNNNAIVCVDTYIMFYLASWRVYKTNSTVFFYWCWRWWQNTLL